MKRARPLACGCRPRDNPQACSRDQSITLVQTCPDNGLSKPIARICLVSFRRSDEWIPPFKFLVGLLLRLFLWPRSVLIGVGRQPLVGPRPARRGAARCRLPGSRSPIHKS